MMRANSKGFTRYLTIQELPKNLFGSLYFMAKRSVRNVIPLLILGVLGWYACESRNESTALFHVYSTVDTTDVAVGDVIHFQVWAKASGDRIVTFPPLIIDNQNIGIGEGRRLEGEHSDDYGIEYAVTLWDTGSFQLPSYSVNIMDSEDESVDYTISTEPVNITVHTVITDTQPALRDIKPPVPIPFVIPFRPILTIIAIVVLLGLLIWLWRQRIVTKESEPEIYIPSRPPQVIALEKLQELQEMVLDSNQQIKEFYSQLSYIAREYLEYQFFIRAIEMTTAEIETVKHLIPLEESVIEKLLEVLKRSDLAKFARFQPDAKQCIHDLEAISYFVKMYQVDWSLAQYQEEKLEVT